jgi:hypothetical protein
MCDDIANTLQELAAKGVETTGPISDQGWGLLASVRLPGGSDLQLYQPRHPSPTTWAVSRRVLTAPLSAGPPSVGGRAQMSPLHRVLAAHCPQGKAAEAAAGDQFRLEPSRVRVGVPDDALDPA